MAKTGVLETSPSAVTKATAELKKELQRLVQAILDQDDYTVEIIDEAMRILRALRELKFKKSSLSLRVVDDKLGPEEFRCPISRELMADPVVLASGETYDRPFIQRWLDQGHQTCPQTQKDLSHTILTPNQLVHELISHWCNEHGIELPKSAQDDDDDVVSDADRGYFDSVLEKTSSSLSDQKEAAKELRRLTKKGPTLRTLFSESANAISQLLSPLSPGSANTHPDLQEDLITTVFNISIPGKNKRLVAENPLVMTLLIESLNNGTTETRRNAAAALFTLSEVDSNKLLIAKSGAFKPLIDLLEEGHLVSMTDAASAIFKLCCIPENRVTAVLEGAVRVIMKKIRDSVVVDEVLSILPMLASHPKAVEEMVELGAVPCLLRIIRDSSSEVNKENCVSILHTICFNDDTTWKGIKEEEISKGTLAQLAKNGTSRAKRKANDILEKLFKGFSVKHSP